MLAVWRGGMSFHGGLIGVLVATFLFARRRGFAFFELTDALAVATPIGLFLGRIANFINAELWGRATDLPWGVVFPTAGPEPRHPSQLYEAGLEGLAPVRGDALVRAPPLRPSRSAAGSAASS